MQQKNPKGQKSLTTSNTSTHLQKHTSKPKNQKNNQSKTKARSNNCSNNRSNNYSNGKKSRSKYQVAGKMGKREGIRARGGKDDREFMSRTLDAGRLAPGDFGPRKQEKDGFDKQSVLEHLCITYKINPRKIALNKSPPKKLAFIPAPTAHPKPLQLPLKQQYQQSISKIFHILDIFSRGTISEANINRWVPQAALYFLGTVFQKIRNNRLVLTEAEFLRECERVYERSGEPDIREFVGNIRRFSDINQEKVSMQAGTQPRQHKQTIQSHVQDKFTLNPALLTITPAPEQHSFRAMQPKLTQNTMPLFNSHAHAKNKINTNTGRENQCDNGVISGYGCSEGRDKEKDKGSFVRNENRNSLRKQYKKKIILQDNQYQSKQDKQNQYLPNTNIQNKFTNINLTTNPITNKITEQQHQYQQQKVKKQKPRIITPLNDINIFQNVAKSKVNRVVHQVNRYEQEKEKEKEREINLPLKGDDRRDKNKENVARYKYNIDRDVCMVEDNKNTRRSGNQSPFFQATTLKTIFGNQFQHPQVIPSQKSNTTPTSSSIISNPNPLTQTQSPRTSIPPAYTSPVSNTPAITITSIIPTINMTINRKMERERAAVGEGDRIDRLAGKLEDYIRRNAERIQMSKNYRDGIVG